MTLHFEKAQNATSEEIQFFHFMSTHWYFPFLPEYSHLATEISCFTTDLVYSMCSYCDYAYITHFSGNTTSLQELKKYMSQLKTAFQFQEVVASVDSEGSLWNSQV